MPHVAFLLGKAPRRSTIFPEVFDRLGAGGVGVSVHLPHDGQVDLPVVRGADLVVHRGLNPEAMAMVAELHAAGARLVNPYPGTVRLSDRVAMVRALDGLPVPATQVVHDWAQVAVVAGPRRCVVKAAGGPGRGAAIAVGTGEELRSDRGLQPPYLVQEFVASDGLDHKLYLVGDEVRGLRKASPLGEGHTSEGAAFTPDAALTDLARRVRARLGLDLLGVDVLVPDDGAAVVVDVNDFPGYRGVDDAAELVAKHLLARLG